VQLVDQHQVAVEVQSKFILAVHQDQVGQDTHLPPAQEQLERDVLNPLPQRGLHPGLDHFVVGERVIVRPAKFL